MNRTYNIPEFAEYLNVNDPKCHEVLFVSFENERNIRLKSNPVEIDFYMISFKTAYHSTAVNGPANDDNIQPYLYFDGPGSLIQWDLVKPITGYGIFISPKIFDRYAKDYSFIDYGHHEPLYVNDDEVDVLLDLFKKVKYESVRDQYSLEIIASYANLILTYVQKYYQRQFETNSVLYNKLVAEFKENLESYFRENESIEKLPTVVYFAELSNLSANYFGDLVKHFTGNSPQWHIQQRLLEEAKQRLQHTDLSVSEIAFSLGFEYPTYFTRFFKKEVGMTPTSFRNQ